MKQYRNTTLLLLLFAVVNTAGWLAGCKKDNDDKNTGITELLSFGPTGAQPGDTIRFYGRNLDKVTDIQFTGATVASSGFISKSASEIYVIVPTETEKGYVVLKTPSGDITTKTQFNIAIAAVVTSVTSVARPGETITIQGNYLNWVTGVTFSDDKEVTALAFISQSQAELKVKVPDDAKTGTLMLAYGGTDPDKLETTDTLHVTLPVAVTLSPNPAKQADELTITGTDLDLATKVYFSGVPEAVTTFVSQSATAIKVKIPGATVSGPITLQAASGVKTVSTSALNMVMPSVSQMTPNPAKHADELTITGTNLDLATKVYFSGVADAVTTFVSQSATVIKVKIPGGTVSGPITLQAASGEKAVSTTALNMVMPSVTQMTPNPVATKSNLTITGINLNMVTKIEFTGVATPVTAFESQTATSIVVKVPEGTLKGFIALSVLNSTVKVQSPAVLDILGGLPPLADFPKSIYTDQFDNGFQNNSWAVNDIASSAIVRQGEKSIKATYGGDGYQGITFHYGDAAGLNITAYSKLEFSIFGEAGTGGKKMNVVVNGNWGTPNVVTITAGEWSTYTINFTDIKPALDKDNPLKEIVLQAAGFSGVVHIDHVGLR